MIERTPLHIVAATVLVRNPQGEILLVRTHKRGWELPGGQVEQGETATDGALREVLEESGIVCRIQSLGCVHSNLSRNIVVFGFLGDYVSGALQVSEETPEVRWTAQEEASALITHEAIRDRVHDLLAYTGIVTYRAYTTQPYRVITLQTL